ncbi:uncharacterized protein LOC112595705 [Melanaphis sacchari]|uniref:uncharacterized protein LOC112595705 n=1 Tax=Melanaphis sacchari TaxID=742174 RepID=UPI000DC14FF1|nr:uncharacterized protein LOC112595705 [Melanaphis sacchari]
MGSYTEVDMDNARKFLSNYNTRVRMMELMYKKYPRLMSHATYTVRDATSENYYIPRTLRDKCKIIDVDISEKLCDKLSCNKYTASGFCMPETKTHYVRVGDGKEYDTVCQPAYFNTNVDPTYSQDNTRSVDTPQLRYHKNKCITMPDFMTNYLEKPFYRSITVYENRVNDIPTGFTRINDTESEFGCGWSYKNNTTYCKYYDRTLDDNGDCSYKWWEKRLNAVVGMSFINSVKSVVRKIDTKKFMFDVPDLPEIPDTLDEKDTLGYWKRDINESFSLPKLMIYDEDDDDGLKNRVLYAKQKISENRAKRMVGKAPSGNASNNDNDDDVKNSNSKDAIKTAMDAIDHIVANLGDILFSKEGLVSLGINLAYQYAETKIKKMLKSLAQNLSKLLKKNIGMIIAKAFPIKCLQASIMNLCRLSIVKVLIQSATKMAIALAKLTALAVSVVGWILIVVNILGVILSIWDPFGYNNMFPSELPANMTQKAERALRAEMGESYAQFTFEMLCSKLLTKQEILEITMSRLTNQLIYLNALVVNSEGSIIDKEDPVYFEESTESQKMLEESYTQNTAKHYHFNSRQYREYNENYLKRVITNKFITSAFHATAVGHRFGLWVLRVYGDVFVRFNQTGSIIAYVANGNGFCQTIRSPRLVRSRFH